MEFKAAGEKVQVTGRTLYVDGIRYISFSGSSVCFRFKGKKAQVEIVSDSPDWDEDHKGFVAVYINDGREPDRIIRIDSEKAAYELWESNSEEEVTIRIVKYSEEAFCKCGISRIMIDTDILLDPPVLPGRRIEFVGDSITCGFGVESTDENDVFRTPDENPAKAYALITAGMLEAQAQLVSWSGIGVLSNWVEEDVNEPLTNWLMPMLYQYTDASCSKFLYGEDRSKWEKWDFDRYVPDIIVVNLGSNDSSYCRDIKERHEAFRDAYARFLGYIGEHNPSSHVLCILGTMDRSLCPDVEEAVMMMNDDRFHYLGLPLQEKDIDGIGADFHPSPATQRKTAETVSAEIRRIMNWK